MTLIFSVYDHLLGGAFRLRRSHARASDPIFADGRVDGTFWEWRFDERNCRCRRYDVTNRWSLISFVGIGRVADTFGDLGSADDHTAIGGGFRYLIARQYGMRMGLDVAYGDDGDWSVYVTMGTGWVRP